MDYDGQKALEHVCVQPTCEADLAYGLARVKDHKITLLHNVAEGGPE